MKRVPPIPSPASACGGHDKAGPSRSRPDIPVRRHHELQTRMSALPVAEALCLGRGDKPKDKPSATIETPDFSLENFTQKITIGFNLSFNRVGRPDFIGTGSKPHDLLQQRHPLRNRLLPCRRSRSHRDGQSIEIYPARIM